ncbi:transglycosylase domain-containing protein [Candidatus Gottesmanbacteria bacterium]|nr:transglycosylase domain-containing protein [Candidatus Gottesmanbacteria bacterium]
MISLSLRIKTFLKTASNKQIAATITAIMLFLTLSTYWFILRDLPFPTKLSNRPSETTKIFDRNNVLLYQIYVGQNRTIVPLNQIPDSLKKATIAIEDKDFYRHQGINVIHGMFRAVKDMALYRKNLQGGSTITQQLVKTTLLSSERTLRRKLKEALLALLVEKLYSKDQLLEMYLNQVPYGGTAWGVGAAAEKYFGKKVNQLTLAESALLAGLPAAPSYYSPFGNHPELATKRQAEVLRRMREDGYITKDDEERAMLTTLTFNLKKEEIKAPHFVMYVKEILEKKYGGDLVERGGLQVTTTLDYSIQNFAQQTVATEVAKLKNLDVGNGATLVTRPATGEILAMVGSRDYFDLAHDGNVNVTLALRQPGSAIKPINYAVGLMKGYTPATLFIDSPTCFANIAGQRAYCPVNYDAKWHGPVQLRFALGNSFNIPAVKMLALNGVHDMIATASAMGISTLSDESRYGLSLTLGGGEVKMAEMATAFGTFANAGVKKDLDPILKVVDSTGKLLEENKEAISWNQKPKHSLLDISGTRVLPFEVAFLISHILLDNNARSQAFGEDNLLRIPSHPAVSVKTGTTDDKRDNWTIGYTPSFLTVVWVGNNDNTPMNPYLASGVTGAAPIWHKIMSFVLKSKPDEWPLMPANIAGLQVCSLSGKLPGDSGCPTRFEYFIRGTEPKEIEEVKRKILVDNTTHKMAKPGQTDNVSEEEHVVVKDAFTGYCLDCSHDNDEPAMISKWNY